MKRKASKEGDAGPKTARPEAEIGNTDWEAKTVVQLRALLKRRGLPTSGQKAQLISRLRDNKSDSDSGTITNKRLKTKAKEDEEAKEEEEEDEMAEIDYIVKERTVPRSKRKEYLVRWVDGAEDGWLPESDLRGTPALKEWKDAIPPEDEAPALPPHRLDALVVQLAKLVEASRRMVVYTGAGISTSAGIPGTHTTHTTHKLHTDTDHGTLLATGRLPRQERAVGAWRAQEGRCGAHHDRTHSHPPRPGTYREGQASPRGCVVLG
jgi:hypothetical protein